MMRSPCKNSGQLCWPY